MDTGRFGNARTIAEADEAADAMARLLGRHSIGPKHLRGPGPDDAAIDQMARAALRGPDHGKRVPFRFVVARGEALLRLADLFEDYGRRRGKTGEALADERVRATQAPVVIAVVARIDDSDPDVPPHEQWACVGGALANAMNALHLMGFGAKMLSGARAADPTVQAAFCRPGETLLGWISAGTPDGPATPRGNDDAGAIVSPF